MSSKLWLPNAGLFWRELRTISGWLFILLLASGCNQDGGTFSIGEDTLYADTFSAGETGSWDLEGDAESSASMENDQLTIAVSGANVLHYVTLEQPQFSDFALEIDATLQSGSASDTYGVLFRLQPAQQPTGAASFYRFELTASGDYVLERHNADGSWTRLTDGWRRSDAIEQGVGASNRLQLVAGGNSFSIFVNGTPLGRYTDPDPLLQGSIAVDAATYGPSNLLVSFDNLAVRSP